MIIQKIVEYVEKNLTEKIDYDELSRECAANKYNMTKNGAKASLLSKRKKITAYFIYVLQIFCDGVKIT